MTIARLKRWGIAYYSRTARDAAQYLANFDFRDCKQAMRSLDLAGWVYNTATLSAPGEAEYLAQFEISSNLFSVLGTGLFRGRGFLPAEDQVRV